tara:strand:- start:85328 stop:86491 length:1164 start_codon:yes stop_codon:yes gene_type:complete
MSAETDAVGSANQPIIGGTARSAGDFPTTVAISNGGLCTGTLIAPDLILTAAHCITPALLGANSQAQVTSQTQVLIDADSVFNDSGSRIQAADTIPHPSFSVNSLGNNDIGLIRLATPVTDRLPTPINRFNEDAPAGIIVTQVGYGATQVGGSQAGNLFAIDAKATTSCSPFGVSDANLLCFSQTDGQGKCQGDSGGPSFATIGGIERVVGVTSFGDQTCAQFGADTRVDAELDFLYTHAPELQCQVDGACNEDCGKGELPTDDDCTVCTKDSECEDAEVCAADGSCVAAPFTPGGDGFECSADEQCDSSLCANAEEDGTCTSLCTSDEQCSDGFECIEAGAQSVCWPESSGSGGCSIGGTSEAPIGALLIALAMLLALKPRRRREY